jgi:hypothetical protein
MTVFIAHAKADAETASSLKKTLDSRGLWSELETGERGFRHLGPLDVVVALWSKSSTFDPHRLQFERRALDAWADGRLVFVKLDPHFAPVGLRDLPFVDAQFESGRESFAWPEVARRAREASAPPGALNQTYGKMTDAMGTGAAPPAAPGEARDRSVEREAAQPAKKRKGGFWGGLFGGGRKEAARAEAGPPASAPASAPDAVFVSYSRTDAGFVLPVCNALKSQGKQLWLDQEGIDAGESWAGEIVRAIRTVKGVAVMCSKAAFESDHVKREVYLADRYKKRLLPVLIDDTPMPDDFEYFFAGVQQLELHKTPEADRPGAMARALGIA